MEHALHHLFAQPKLPLVHAVETFEEPFRNRRTTFREIRARHFPLQIPDIAPAKKDPRKSAEGNILEQNLPRVKPLPLLKLFEKNALVFQVFVEALC